MRSFFIILFTHKAHEDSQTAPGVCGSLSYTNPVALPSKTLLVVLCDDVIPVCF